MKLITIAAAILAISVGFGCSKKQPTAIPAIQTPVTAYKFENTTDKALTFDIYKSSGDYYSDSNVYFSFNIPSHSVYSVSVDSFIASANYYIDWYDSSYTYTNWGHRDSFTIFRPTNTDTLFSTSGVFVPSNARLIFLNGHGTKTNWIAVNNYGESQLSSYFSLWTNLPPSEKYHLLTFCKNYTGVEKYYDTYNNDSINDNIGLAIINHGPLVIANFNYNQLKSNFTSSASWNYSSPETTSIDTILIYNLNSAGEFLSLIKY